MAVVVFEWRWSLVAIAVAVVAFPVWPASASSACESRADYRIVEGLGLACDADFGHWILLDDGSRIFTHGFDPLAGPIAPHDDGPLADYLSPPLAPPCVANPALEYHNYVLYTRPGNKPDRYAEMAPLLRSMAEQANNHLRNEAAETSDLWTSYKFRCAGGQVEVANLTLLTPSGSDNFGTLVSNVRSLGYASPFAHYWIWHDDGLAEGAAGIGEFYGDDRATASNANNFGPRYAATLGIVGTDGASGAFVMMHENGHNMGAVQTTSPFSSHLGHCNDDADVMCYVEGVGADAAPVCLGRQHFDCNHNDYFHPTPNQLNYLSNHWNIGSRVNRFLTFSDAAPLPHRPTLAAASGPEEFAVTLTWTPAADTGDSALVAFHVYGGSRAFDLGRLAVVPANETTYVDASPGGARFYRVSAVNAQGEGSPSAVVRVDTPPAPPTPPPPPKPGVPLGVLATPSGDGRVLIQWSEPVEARAVCDAIEEASTGASEEVPCGAHVVGYRVLRSNGAFGGNFERGVVPATQRTFEDTVPATGTFGYTVIAFNENGDGDPSAKAVVLAVG